MPPLGNIPGLYGSRPLAIESLRQRQVDLQKPIEEFTKMQNALSADQFLSTLMLGKSQAKNMGNQQLRQANLRRRFNIQDIRQAERASQSQLSNVLIGQAGAAIADVYTGINQNRIGQQNLNLINQSNPVTRGLPSGFSIGLNGFPQQDVQGSPYYRPDIRDPNFFSGGF
jgi:hypothetical protein